ncbi:MAG TPA: hypothetical protein VI792_08625, partial [Candidatus Eisenbacteria bacterium]
MSAHAPDTALAALAWSAAIAVVIAWPARAADVVADSTRLLGDAHATLSPDALRLGLAARARSHGDLRGVIENL